MQARYNAAYINLSTGYYCPRHQGYKGCTGRIDFGFTITLTLSRQGRGFFFFIHPLPSWNNFLYNYVSFRGKI